MKESLSCPIKTIFLCRYIASEELRREIHEGLNVAESWNSTNGFIFYGKGSELATNKRENQEMGLLCLHLLQDCLVYINTLMIQQVLKHKNIFQKEINIPWGSISHIMHNAGITNNIILETLSGKLKLRGIALVNGNKLANEISQRCRMEGRKEQ
jgi:hypothetical protein